MRPEELSLVVNDTIARMLVSPRYSGKLSLHFELVCFQGGIRECAVDVKKIVTSEELTRLNVKSPNVNPV